MGHHHQWARFEEPVSSTEHVRRQHGGRGRRGGPWAEFADVGRAFGGPGGPGGFGGRGGRSGPPPWLAGIFGTGPAPDQRRGPRVRRGDVRFAILSVLKSNAEQGAEQGNEQGAGQQPTNGYQVIQQIADSTDGVWRPSPGSVYPTIQLLQDEGLVESTDDHGRTALGLTDAGRTYVEDHAAELAAVWAPFEQQQRRESRAGGIGDVKAEIGQVMGAVWQIVTSGSEAQQRAAIGVLVDTRRKLYGILADGDEGLVGADGAEDPEDPEGAELGDEASEDS